ncbi:MAG: YmdB family metallophosphoesterase [Lentisphaeria bacterium]|nr:YmdB family metallophosphoesterase [Lentisphaeria bacterium]
MKLIFLGDIVGKGGREAVKALVPELRREYNAQFVVVNGENSAAGNGITASCARELLSVADVITCGDHVWDQKGFDRDIDLFAQIVRPANLHPSQPGKGWNIYRNPAGGEIAVISLQGKVFMRDSACDPFITVDEILKKIPASVKNIIVDFHAEATSEKLAMGYFLNGRVTAVFGTHTHVQTADAAVLDGGTAYITDAGMCGGAVSVLGREVPDVLHKFTTGMPNRLNVVEKGDIRLCGAVVTFDHLTGKALNIELLNRIFTV